MSEYRLAWGLVVVAVVVAMADSGSAHAADGRQCLARTVYFEARGDGRAGMAAVAAVVLNRVAHADFPDDVCAVVKEGGEEPPCQFSYWCDGESDRPRNEDEWGEAVAVADRALAGELESPVGDALFFHSDRIEPPFNKPRERVATVGSHHFYR